MIKKALRSATSMTMLGLAIMTAGAPGGSANAQQAALDTDGLIACGVIYREISISYAEKGDFAQADSFAETSSAYGASALTAIGYRLDALAATDETYRRQNQIVATLDAQAASNPQGDFGVIAEWLPYCDGIAGTVRRLLEVRDRRGW